MITFDDLLTGSGLPGPRANLALLARFAREADPAVVEQCLACDAPGIGNTPREFALMAGVLARGAAASADPAAALAFARPYAAHESWQVREAVAMLIQDFLADAEPALLAAWVSGSHWEQRALVAGFCEPRLMKREALRAWTVGVLEAVTASVARDGKLTPGEEALRKALGYGWSVAIAPDPASRARFERLLEHPSKHVRWIVLENLKKDRLVKADAAWVDRLRQRAR